MINESQNNNAFYEHLSIYMRLLEEQGTGNQESELYNHLIEMVIQGETSEVDVIRALSQIFLKYPTQRLVLLYIMRAVVVGSQLKKGYNYPEFFWIIVESDLLSKIDSITDVVSVLMDICGKDILRSYLVYKLLTNKAEEQLKIIQAFYYVSHTMNTLKILNNLIPLESNNEKVYIYLYSDALNLLYTDQASTLDDDDKFYLKTFFERGLQFGSPQIAESCRKALNRLGTIS